MMMKHNVTGLTVVPLLTFTNLERKPSSNLVNTSKHTGYSKLDKCKKAYPTGY